MARVDLDELERKARAAEQDEWRWRRGDSGVLEGVRNGQVVLWAPGGNADTDEPALIVSISNAAHIAANSPPVTIALIARIRELETALRFSDDDPNRIIGVLGAVTIAELLEKGVVLE